MRIHPSLHPEWKIGMINRFSRCNNWNNPQLYSAFWSLHESWLAFFCCCCLIWERSSNPQNYYRWMGTEFTSMVLSSVKKIKFIQFTYHFSMLRGGRVFLFKKKLHSCWHSTKKKKRKRNPQSSLSPLQASSEIAEVWRGAACPSHSSVAITEDDCVCSLQEMSLKRLAKTCFTCLLQKYNQGWWW